MLETLGDRYVYLMVVALLSIGLFTLLVERHLVKKLVGLVIFQTAIFVFFIEGSVKDGGDVPVIDPAIGTDPVDYVNPLPHLLILTALVVGVAVIGVALALIVTIQRAYGTLDDAALSGQSGSVASGTVSPPSVPATPSGGSGPDRAAGRLDPPAGPT
ncbi:MAG TPA: cation:proton antiporter subunit C [Acidimicrobiales bacterium]|nr:cation:proton antiporter subunit C [Acidimicrobiales bacterium]